MTRRLHRGPLLRSATAIVTSYTGARTDSTKTASPSPDKKSGIFFVGGGHACKLRRVLRLRQGETTAIMARSPPFSIRSRLYSSWPMLRREFHLCLPPRSFSNNHGPISRCGIMGTTTRSEPSARGGPGHALGEKRFRCIPCINITVIRPTKTHRCCITASHRA